MTSSRRRSQRGQVVPITAVMSTVLLGITALAVDISLQSHRHRNLENAADAAAMVAARDLGASSVSANQADRLTAATDALRVVYDHMGWGSQGSTWASNVVHAQTGTNCGNGASATHCDVSTTGPGSGSNLTVVIAVPPLGARNAAYNEQAAAPGQPWGYAEVDIYETDGAVFGTFAGMKTETAGGHAVAYHHPAGVPFGFALWSGTIAQGGNAPEIVEGNVYAYRDVVPQSNGQAYVCSADDPSGNHGHIVLGSPQTGPFPVPDPAGGAPYQSNVRPPGADTVSSVAQCTASAAQTIDQTAPLGSCGSLTVQGVVMTTSQDPASLACVASPPLLPPDIQGPSRSGNVVTLNGSGLGNNQSVLTVTSSLAPGLYDVIHNPNCAPPSCTDVVVDGHSAPSNCAAQYSAQYTTCLLGVTFWLDQGATIGVINGARLLLSPYQPPAGTTQDPNDGRYIIYAPLGSPAEVVVHDNGTVFGATGTVYMPTGTFSDTSNGVLDIVGQVIVNTWTVQSGNGPVPEVTYNPAYLASEREELRLVE